MRMTIMLKRMLSVQRPSFFRFSFVMISLLKPLPKEESIVPKT